MWLYASHDSTQRLIGWAGCKGARSQTHSSVLNPHTAASHTHTHTYTHTHTHRHITIHYAPTFCVM